MASGPSSPTSPSPESSIAIVGRDQDDARSSSSSSSSSSRDSISSSDNNQGSVRANDDNGDDGVMVSKDSVGGGSSDEVVVSEDAGREDMFLDASEDLGADGRESSSAYTEPRDNSDNEQQVQFRGFDTGMQNDYMVDEMERLRAVLDKTLNEKDSIARECKDEIEMAAKAIANLRDQMRGLVNDSTGLLPDDMARFGDGFVGPEMGDTAQSETHLHEMIHECQMLIGTVLESRKQDEGVVRQLQDDVSELTISRDVVDSYVSSVNNMSMESQLQKDQYIDDAANRMLGSLASVVYVEQLMDNSLTSKVAHLEKAMFALLENYNWFLYETDQLRLRLVEVRPDLAEQIDYALVFATSRDELLDLKRKEVEFVEKLSHLENEHGKLKEQLDKCKTDAESANAELQKTRAELEQEKNRYLNTKEKLSLAVTKGKALVQQRDSLKQNLADKSAELEKYLAELEEKSTALESAELIKEELTKCQISNASLHDVLAQKDMLLEKLEEVLFESGAPEGLRSMDITGRIRWLVDDHNALKDVSHTFHTLVDSLFSIYLPENIPSSNLESQLGWIRESFDNAKAEISALQDEICRMKEAAQDEIEKLTYSLSTTLVEKDCLKVDLDDITLKYDEAVDKELKASSEKKKVLGMLLEVAGLAMDYEEDTTFLVQQCLAKMKEEKGSSLESTQMSMETFACMQALIYVRDQGLVLCEQLLEEEMQENSELNRMLYDLRNASEEVDVLKNERDSLRKDLERSEDKSALIREKLSMAVKKGKGLVQEKENLKRLIDEKSAEIEGLRSETQQKESIIDDCRDQITRLSAELGRLPQLEGDLAALRDQTTHFEKDLMESNNLLQGLTEFIDGIVNPLSSEFEDPIEKVKWLGEYLSNCRAEKEIVEQELQTVKLDAETTASELLQLNSTIKSLEEALSVAENNMSQLVEEKRDLEVGKTSLEDQFRGAVEESLTKASLFAEATAAKASLESAFSQAENTISMLKKEKEESESSRAATEAELANLKDEVSILRTRLEESSSSIKSLEDAATHLETTVALLTEERNDAETGKTNAENELQNLKEEADSWDHKLQDAHSKIGSLQVALEQAESSLSALSNEKSAAENEMFTEATAAKSSLESALSEAEVTISVLRKEKEESDSFRADAEAELANLKEEVSVLRTRLAESSSSVKSLEDAISELETTVALLTEEKVSAETGETNALNELQKLKEEVSSWDHKLQEAAVKIKSLESALEQADINLSVLSNEKNAAENEIFTLTAKLNACMEELSRMHGGLESQSVELFGHLKDLELFITEEPIFSFLEQCSRKKMEAMKEMDLMFRNIRNQFAAVCRDNLPATEEVSCISKVLPGDLDNLANIQFDSDKGEAVEIGAVSSYVQNMVERYRAKNRSILQKFDVFSNLDDGFNAAVLEEIRETMGRITPVVKMTDSLYQEIRNLETDKSALENEIAILENEIGILESACTDATKELGFDFVKQILDSSTSSKTLVETEQDFEKNKHALAAEKLLSTTREVRNVLVQFQKSEGEFATIIQQMQDELSEKRVAEEKAIMELNLNKSKNSKLETDLKVLQDSYNDLTLKLEESQASKVNLGDREAEISSLHSALLMKEQEVAAATLWASQVKAILNKAIESGISTTDKEGGSLEVQDSAYIKSLHYIMDNFAYLQHQNKLLSHEKQELQFVADSQLHEIENLKKQCEKDVNNEYEMERVKNEFGDLVAAVGRVIQKLGGRGFTEDSKLVATSELVETLEKLAMGLVTESDNSKTRVQELNAELLANQEDVDELLSKVKVLEHSLQDRRVGPPEIIQERSIFEAPSPPPASEISEIEEVATVAKPSISPVPSAAHARTMRKGLSNEHIALDIESERLITDDDKGHVFKSLNASGLIPKQGKVVADRVDGVWVSAGRVLMSRPRARLGLIAYWLLLHIWLLGTIL